MKYNAARGGHAPGHLRDSFQESVENANQAKEIQWWQHIDADNFFDARLRALPKIELARGLLGQLWNCTDVMPSELCTELELPAGSTYAVAARRLKPELPQAA